MITTMASPVTSPATTRTPLHLWIVGGLSLLWNAFGALDYLMTQFQVEAYMSAFTPEQVAYFYGFPVWVDMVWTFGVWGSVAGSIGLLLRKRWAATAFVVSLAGLLGCSLYTMILTDGLALMGGVQAAISAVIWALIVGLMVYSVVLTRRGVLR